MNNKLTYPLIALCLCLTAAFVAADAGMPQFAFTPDQMKFGPPPPFIAPGAQVAVLEGNPAGSDGDYTVRVKMPDGYKIAPHWHPTRENVTVISGALKVGMGDKFEDSKDQLPGREFRLPGSQCASLRAGVRQYYDSNSRGSAAAIQLRECGGRSQQEVDSRNTCDIRNSGRFQRQRA